MPVSRLSRGPATTIAVFVALLAMVGAVLTARPAAAQEDQSSGVVTQAASANAYGVAATTALLGTPLLALPPTPAVAVTASDALMPNARDSILDVGPVGDGPGLGEVNVVEVNALADIEAGVARASAVTADVDLLLPAVGADHVVSADVLSAVSSSSCTSQTPEEAAAGTTLVGLRVAGQAIPIDVPINTVIEVPGVAAVHIKEVVADTDGFGWTVRALRVQTLDPLSGVVAAEVIVSEAHTTVACGMLPPPPPPPEDPNAFNVQKAVVGGELLEDGTVRVNAGEDLTYGIEITNIRDRACTLETVTDVLPAPLRFVDGRGGLAAAPGQPQTNNAVRFDLAGVVLQPGETFTGDLVAGVPDTIAEGSYFNDAIAEGDCGSGRSGLTAGITIDGPEDPCSAPNRTRATSGSTRFAGDDRSDTALRVSGMISVDEADAVVIARSDEFPDALAASGLAAELCAPLLLNIPSSLQHANLEEMRRLEVLDVYLVGGQNALSDDVARAIRDAGFNVIRVGGATRYETAREIAFEIVRLGGPVDGATFVRADIFPDAMSAANLATHARSPILLTDSGSLNQTSADALPSILRPGIDPLIYIGGGSAAIDPSVEAELGRAYRTRRLAGLNRFETSVAFIEEAVSLGAIRDITWFASGLDFPDALTGSVGAYREGSAILLTAPQTLEHSVATRSYLQSYADAITTAVIVGGPRAISEDVEQQILDSIRD